VENFQKSILIFPEISGNLLKSFYTIHILIITMFPSPALQSNAINKHVFDKQLSRYLYFNFIHC